MASIPSKGVFVFCFNNMNDESSFTKNIKGVDSLVSSGMNKTNGTEELKEGIMGSPIEILELNMDDEELIRLAKQQEIKVQLAEGEINLKGRQKLNKAYYLGKTNDTNGGRVTATNLIFEAEETFIPQALSRNPDPVVWSDDSKEGQEASNQIKTMLQYKAHTLGLRGKLGVMVRHWSVYFIGVKKYGWSTEDNDIKDEIRKPKNFLLDPDAWIDEFGNYVNGMLGELIESTAKQLVELYPKHKTYITLKVDGKMGTKVVRTEWWTDEYCFVKYGEVILDKYKNPFFNYETKEKDMFGTETVTPAKNHFNKPRMPYTFLSVFSLQESPYDVTSLIEQSIPNQDRITDRDIQISKNLAAGNNAIVLSGESFTSENAHQAAMAIEKGHPIIVPNGNTEAVKRLPANDIPSAVFNAQENDKEALRSIFGTSGLSAQKQDENTTARGMILNQSHDSSRIGGGIGEAIERVSDNTFNWYLQLMYVFYDEPHYASMIGNGQAVTYVQLVNSDINRHFNIKVEPDSMKPKDEVSEQNLAVELWQQKALDPISLFQKMNYPDPMDTAKKVALWTTNPQLYMQMYFPEQPVAPDSANPQVGGQPQPQPADTQTGLSAPPASASLSNVPLNTASMPQ